MVVPRSDKLLPPWKNDARSVAQREAGGPRDHHNQQASANRDQHGSSAPQPEQPATDAKHGEYEQVAWITVPTECKKPTAMPRIVATALPSASLSCVPSQPFRLASWQVATTVAFSDSCGSEEVPGDEGRDPGLFWFPRSAWEPACSRRSASGRATQSVASVRSHAERGNQRVLDNGHRLTSSVSRRLCAAVTAAPCRSA